MMMAQTVQVKETGSATAVTMLSSQTKMMMYIDRQDGCCDLIAPRCFLSQGCRLIETWVKDEGGERVVSDAVRTSFVEFQSLYSYFTLPNSCRVS